MKPRERNDGVIQMSATGEWLQFPALDRQHQATNDTSRDLVALMFKSGRHVSDTMPRMQATPPDIADASQLPTATTAPSQPNVEWTAHRRRGLANWQVRRVTSYMSERLDQEVCLNDLARLVNLSRFHFCTAFRLATGQTPREWLIARRIERACKLLAQPTLSITKVGLAVGYATPSAFAASFHKRMGMTPSEFRRAL